MSAVWIRTVKTSDVDLEQCFSEVTRSHDDSNGKNPHNREKEKLDFPPAGEIAKGEHGLSEFSEKINATKQSESRFDDKEKEKKEEKEGRGFEEKDNENEKQRDIFPEYREIKSHMRKEDHHRSNRGIEANDDEVFIIQNKHGRQSLNRNLNSKYGVMEIGQEEHPGKAERIQFPKDNNDSGIDTPDIDIGLITFRKMLDEFRKTLREEFATENIGDSEGFSSSVVPIIATVGKVEEQKECKEHTDENLESADHENEQGNSYCNIENKGDLSLENFNTYSDNENDNNGYEPGYSTSNSIRTVQRFDRQQTFVKNSRENKEQPPKSCIENTENIPKLNLVDINEPVIIQDIESRQILDHEDANETEETNSIPSNLKVSGAQRLCKEDCQSSKPVDDSPQSENIVENQPQANICNATKRKNVPTTVSRDQQISSSSSDDIFDNNNDRNKPQHQIPLLSSNVSKFEPDTKINPKNFKSETEENTVNVINNDSTSENVTPKESHFELRNVEREDRVIRAPSIEVDTPLISSSPREVPPPRTDDTKNRNESDAEHPIILHDETLNETSSNKAETENKLSSGDNNIVSSNDDDKIDTQITQKSLQGAPPSDSDNIKNKNEPETERMVTLDEETATGINNSETENTPQNSLSDNNIDSNKNNAEINTPVTQRSSQEGPPLGSDNTKNLNESETEGVVTLNNSTVNEMCQSETEDNQTNSQGDDTNIHVNIDENNDTHKTFDKIEELLKKVLDDEAESSHDNSTNCKENEIIPPKEGSEDAEAVKNVHEQNKIKQVENIQEGATEVSSPKTDEGKVEINASLYLTEGMKEDETEENHKVKQSSQAEAQARAEQRKNSNVQMQFGTNGLHINSEIPSDQNQMGQQPQMQPQLPYDQQQQAYQQQAQQQQQIFQQTATPLDQQRELQLYQQQQQQLQQQQLQNNLTQQQQQPPPYYQQQELQMPPQQPVYGQQVGPYDGGGTQVGPYTTNPYSTNTYPSTTAYPTSLPEFKQNQIPAQGVPYQSDVNAYTNTQPLSTVQNYPSGEQVDPNDDPYGPNHPSRRRREGRDHTNYNLPPNLDPFKTNNAPNGAIGNVGPPGLPVLESGDYGDQENGLKLVVLDKTDDEDEDGMHRRYSARPNTDVYKVDKEAVDRDLYKQEYIPQVNTAHISTNDLLAENGPNPINHNPPVPITNAFGINNDQNVNQNGLDTPKNPSPTFAFNVTDFDSETGGETGRSLLGSQQQRQQQLPQQQMPMQLYNPNQHYPYFDPNNPTNDTSTAQQLALQQGQHPSATHTFQHPDNNGVPQQLYSMSLVDYERFTSNPSQLSTVREDLDDMETYRSEPIPQQFQGVDNRTFLIHPSAMQSNHHMNGAQRPEFKILGPGYKFQVNKENVVKRATRANILSRAEQLLDARRGQLTDRSDSSDELRRVNDGDDEDEDKFYDMTGPRHQALKHLRRRVYDDTTSYNSSDDVLNIMKLNPRGPVTQAARRARLTSVNARLNKQKRIRAARRQYHRLQNNLQSVDKDVQYKHKHKASF